MQLDILEGFQNYDEAVFKRNMQKEVLKNGLAAQNIKQTEINLLNSNRIDRKTILLNHMEMFGALINHLKPCGAIKIHLKPF